jgi:hypothetical protein
MMESKLKIKNQRVREQQVLKRFDTYGMRPGVPGGQPARREKANRPKSDEKHRKWLPS